MKPDKLPTALTALEAALNEHAESVRNELGIKRTCARLEPPLHRLKLRCGAGWQVCSELMNVQQALLNIHVRNHFAVTKLTLRPVQQTVAWHS